MSRMANFGVFLAIGGVVLWNIAGDLIPEAAPEYESVAPDWSAIASWPDTDASSVEATPDPNRQITAIVLDDSGSMGSDIEPAKAAVIAALENMGPNDRVAVIALNAGVVLPFTLVSDARGVLPNALAPITDNGNTPLTGAIQRAQGLLEEEASAARGFGSFRVIVTTDGAANDGIALNAAVENLARTTPIQVATIGIGIDGGHTLRRSDLGTFVDVANVSALKEALQAAVAENADFSAITNFTDPEG